MKRSGVWGILLAVLLACMPCGALAREQSAQEQTPGEVIEVFLSADRDWVNEPEKIETSLYDADGKPVRLDFSDLLEGENGDLTFTYSSKNGNRYWNAMKPDAEGLATPTGSDNRFVHITDDEDKVLWMGEFAEHDEESAAEGPYVFKLPPVLRIKFVKNKVDVEELSQEITRGLEIIPVDHMDEVLKEALA